VWNSRIKVTFAANTNPVPFVCVVLPYPAASFTATNMDEYLMMPNSKNVVVGALGSGDAVKSITMEGLIP